jgi:energy-coupling factor transporter ATP-binding protein EcfA2
MIEAQHLSKRYGSIRAVDDLSFTVSAGQVTGFLGPNGSGKSTTMRMIVGLDTPSAGQVTVGGRKYGQLRFPLHEVGALLTPTPSTRAAPPATTCFGWPTLTASHDAGSTRFSPPSDWPRYPDAASVNSPSGWDSGSESPRRCSASPTS